MPGEEGGAAGAGFAEDPVVGWVVVIKGPGRGTSVPLGYGMNSIGRSGSLTSIWLGTMFMASLFLIPVFNRRVNNKCGRASLFLTCTPSRMAWV